VTAVAGAELLLVLAHSWQHQLRTVTQLTEWKRVLSPTETEVAGPRDLDCRGSSGSGRTMTIQVTYTAIED